MYTLPVFLSTTRLLNCGPSSSDKPPSSVNWVTMCRPPPGKTVSVGEMAEEEMSLDDRGFCIVRQFWSKTVPNGGAFHSCLGHFGKGGWMGKVEMWRAGGGGGRGRGDDEEVSVWFPRSGWWWCRFQQLLFSRNSWEMQPVTLMLRDGFAWN